MNSKEDHTRKLITAIHDELKRHFKDDEEGVDIEMSKFGPLHGFFIDLEPTATKKGSMSKSIRYNLSNDFTELTAMRNNQSIKTYSLDTGHKALVKSIYTDFQKILEKGFGAVNQ